MYISVHAAAGAAIGQFIGNPIIAFIAGIASHFLLDIIPHGDENINKWKFFKSPFKRLLAASMIDFFVLFVFLIIWMRLNFDISQLNGMVAGMAGGIAPDALWGFHEFSNDPILKKYKKFHAWFHKIIKKKISLKQGFMLQIPIILVLTLLIVLF